jgi:chloramphenicol 3-O-phosphotransferase
VSIPAHRAVLLSGVYGAGKTSVAVEIADILEKRAEPYAVLDLDWLMWFQAPGYPNEDHAMMLANLTAVVGNYRAAGVQSFVLARAVRDREELGSLRSTLSMPLRVVRLTLPVEEIERRLAADVTAGRRDDLAVAREWLATRTGEGVEDIAVPNDRPVRAVAIQIVDWLEWT